MSNHARRSSQVKLIFDHTKQTLIIQDGEGQPMEWSDGKTEKRVEMICNELAFMDLAEIIADIQGLIPDLEQSNDPNYSIIVLK